MSNRLVLWMTVLVLVGIAILFALNLTSILSGDSGTQQYLKLNHVRGIAIKDQGKLYTLNFNQQNQVIDFINRAIPIEKIESGQRQKPNIEEIVIYQFGGAKDLVLTPVAYVDHDLVFAAPDWNSNGYLMDVSEGQFQQLLSQTYDP